MFLVLEILTLILMNQSEHHQGLLVSYFKAVC